MTGMLADRLETSSGDRHEISAIDTQKSKIGESFTEEEKQKMRHSLPVSLQDIQADPNSPLFSVKAFEELNLPENILKGIYANKYQKPSKIQERALPILLKDPPQHMIGQSQSGTGKTATFAITMLARLNNSLKRTQALCVAPSRELARQIMETTQSLAQYTDTTFAYAIPGSYERGVLITAQIIVGTPGTIVDLVRRKMIETQNIKVFVLDEADNMLDQQGLGEMSMRIRTQLPHSTQVLLFSATFPSIVEGFAKRFAPNAYEIRLKTEELSVDGIKQFYLQCANDHERYEALVNIYGLLTIGQSIIFCQRRDTADEIGRRMRADGHYVTSLHGNLDGEKRDKILEEFRKGKSKILLTTNVIARGIDISQVNMVVNYDLPMLRDGSIDYETYLHRIGRTGRFGRVGVSINFVHDLISRDRIQEIEKYFKREIICVPANDLEKLERKIKEALKA